MSDHQEEKARAEMARCNRILRRAGHRFFKGGDMAAFEGPVDWQNPLDELIAREEAAERDAAFEAMELLISDGAELPLVLVEKVNEAVRAGFQQYESAFLRWLFAAGPHPLEVIRRLFAYAKMRDADLLWKMGFRDIGPLLKETHAAAALRCKILFGDTPAGWRKRTEAREAMRRAALGNCNRRGGNKLKPQDQENLCKPKSTKKPKANKSSKSRAQKSAPAR